MLAHGNGALLAAIDSGLQQTSDTVFENDHPLVLATLDQPHGDLFIAVPHGAREMDAYPAMNPARTAPRDDAPYVSLGYPTTDHHGDAVVSTMNQVHDSRNPVLYILLT